MVAHLRANEVDVDRPVITAGLWLDMDPATERFTNCDEANEMLSRPRRAGYELPELKA